MQATQPSIFSYTDYRLYVRDLLKTFPKNGRGQYRRLSEVLKTNTVTISQIFSGQRELSLDQAYETAVFLGLPSPEEEFFLTLVEFSRATLPRYRKRIEDKMRELRRQAQDLKHSLPKTEHISEEALSRFYSDWRYSAIRILCSIPRFQNLKSLASIIDLPAPQLMEHINFLMKYDLLRKKGDKFTVGKASTHLSADSPFIRHRQMTWRMKAYEFMSFSQKKSKNLFFTGPCSISENHFDEFREELNQLIKKFIGRLESSPPDEMACLNIDFFRMT
ncbi:MAG: TIGR02147 family protein [Deltaproteobacteria bacterium]|nr:TIGR02147 family protein [Deltaproteobacteria bacterium]